MRRRTMADDLWSIPLETLLARGAKARAAHYREQAVALRAMASHATTVLTSGDLLELAAKYDALAAAVWIG